MSLGWDKAGKEPEDTRNDLAVDVLNIVRQANKVGKIEELRQKFPPAYAPFLEMLKENGQHLGPLALLDDDRIMVRVGAPYQEGKVYIIDDLKIEELTGIITFGRSPNRKYFALARESGVDVHEGWDGPKVATIQWPTGLEGAPSEFKMEPLKEVPPVTQLLPFPDGERVLLVSSDGIFVLSVDGAIRLHPGTEDLRDHFNWLKKEDSDGFYMGIDMEHGAISPDGKLIAVGSQDSNHLVFNEYYELVGDIGPLSSYPHYTVFSEDGKILACNSCHFYNGATVVVSTSLLSGLRTEPYELDDRHVRLEGSARVYAAISRKDEFIIGDAYGYLRAYNMNGEQKWQHFIGSSIGDIDISRDGKMLIASTYAGFLSIIELDTDEADPFIIGTSTHQELRRWLFWKTERKPLAW